MGIGGKEKKEPPEKARKWNRGRYPSKIFAVETTTERRKVSREKKGGRPTVGGKIRPAPRNI